jgi:hypothetical protein
VIAMNLSGRIWPMLATLARIDMAASIALAAALSIWLAWH